MIQSPAAWLYERADETSHAASQLLYGETLTVIERVPDREWLRIKADRDDYEGWLKASAAAPIEHAATHTVCVPSAPIFETPDFKRPALHVLPLNSAVRLADAQPDAHPQFRALDDRTYIPAKHVEPKPVHTSPLVVAKQFLGTPYAWGGRTYAGIDCSGLVQMALWACGKPCPRDSGDQWRGLGTALSGDDVPREGDLVFFPGHVGFYLDGGRLLHANATHMRTTIDPLDNVIGWVARDHPDGPLTGFKRL